MSRSLILIVAGAAMAPVASADFMTLTTQVSLDGVAWSSSVNANPGTTVNVRYLASWGRNAGLPAVAFGGVTMSQINISGSSAGDAVSNFVGMARPDTQTFGIFDPGTAFAKIDRTDNTGVGSGIQLAQLPVNSGGRTDNPILVFSFQYAISATAPNGPISFLVPGSQMTLAIIYSSPDGANVLVPGANRSTLPATINVPAVGGLPAALAAALLASRRRRR